MGLSHRQQHFDHRDYMKTAAGISYGYFSGVCTLIVTVLVVPAVLIVDCMVKGADIVIIEETSTAITKK